MTNSEKEFNPEQEKTKYWQCEKGLHREQIPPGSFWELGWDRLNSEGTNNDLILPPGSCQRCNPVKP